MRIEIWNAYASNNSGSYTIVGTFSSHDEARRVAGVLAPVLEAEGKWQGSPRTREDPSPLQQFARAQGLPLSDGYEWPQYGQRDAPDVAAIGYQVLIHHDYTTSLPPLFGHFFYAQGGRVEAELDHTHHVLVVIFEVWQAGGGGLAGEDRARFLIDLLTAENGVLQKLTEPTPKPAWRFGDGANAPLVTFGAQFRDLVAGCAAVQAELQSFGSSARIRIVEAAFQGDDPLAFLRS